MTGQLNNQEAVRDCLFSSSGKVYCIAHPFPDGDSLGSIVGLTLILRSRGIDAVPVASGPAPVKYEFLTKRANFLPAPVDVTGATAVVLDCGDLKRLQELGQELTNARMVVNIDHHQGNPLFGQVNLVDTTAAATGLLIWEVFGGDDLPPEAAHALFTAIYTDTGRFSYPNTDSRVLTAAARLVELGARPTEVFQAVYENITPKYIDFLAATLAKIQYYNNRRIALLVLSRAAIEESGLEEGELDSIIDYPRAIAGVQAAAVLKEVGDTFRISLRSKGAVNVARVAQALGGGGHINAAGASASGTLDQVTEQLLVLLDQALEG